MTSLNPIGLSAALPPPSALPSSTAADPATGKSSFRTLFEQGTNELESSEPNSPPSDSTEAQPPDRMAHKKDADPQSTGALQVFLPPALAAENLPLPLKLSLNLFGTKNSAPKGDAADTRDAQSKQSDKTPAAAPQPLIPLAWAMPAPASGLAPAPRETSKPGLAIEPKTEPAKQGNPHIDVDPEPAPAPPAPYLAFALKLSDAEEHSAATSPVVEPPAASSLNTVSGDSGAKPPVKAQAPAVPQISNVQSAQSASTATAGGNADTNTDSRHSDNRQNDSPSIPALAPLAPPATGEASTVAAHFATVQETSAPSATVTEPASAHTPQTAAQTEIPGHTDPTAKTGTANELSFSVSASDRQKVEIRVMDRAGEVRVSVRTPNEDLANTLRGDLGSLTGKLSQSGYATEAFAPASHSGEFSRQQSGSSPDQQQPGGQNGNAYRQGQQQSSQQQGRSGRPAWLEELENSGGNTPVRKDR